MPTTASSPHLRSGTSTATAFQTSRPAPTRRWARDGAGLAFVIDGRGMATPGGAPYLTHWPVVLTSLDLYRSSARASPAHRPSQTSSAVATRRCSSRATARRRTSSRPTPVCSAGSTIRPTASPTTRGTRGLARPATIARHLSQSSCVAGQCVQVGFDPTSIFGAGSLATRPDTMFPLFSSPAVGDLDQDGVPDPIMSGGSLSLARSSRARARRRGHFSFCSPAGAAPRATCSTACPFPSRTTRFS